MTVPARRGFTLVELMVVVVLGGFLALSIYQVLITNSRTFTVNNAQIMGQQSLRAGLDVLFGELREVSTRGGDLVAMDANSLMIRSQRAFGLVCATNYAVNPPQVTAFRVGPAIQSGDSIVIFADNDPERASDDVWLVRQVRTADTTVTCGSEPGQRLTIPNLQSTGDTVRAGGPVRAFDSYAYGLYDIDGEPYLGRRLRSAADPDPLVGPLLRSQGLVFRYLDAMGTTTTVDTLVAQIQVTLRYQSQVRSAQNRLVSDSLIARIYPRN
jgi:prepilin-type N-terminal cleavage/methylation domain-containing protein